jgi:DNA polymerase-3 subunit alpha
VGQIATFGTLKAKGAVRDVGRVLGVPLGDVDRLAKAIDVALAPLDEKKKTLHYAVESDAGLREEMDRDPAIRKLLETAQLIEGSVRTVGMHAAGVVIGRHALWEHVPTGRGQAGENVTQFDKDDVEKAGLVKFDFLGLSNLTMIQHCVQLINQQKKPGDPLLNIDLLPLDDVKSFDIVSRGDTAGIFQCESAGFTRMMVSLKPTEFEDLVAAGALYRPGPLGMGMHTRYIERKHGREPVEFPHENLAEVLKETYGVIVYQEQVMQVAQILAGFSLGEADNLRRAMGKKKVEEMDKWGKIFQKGAVDHGVDADVAAGIFALMAKFAEYGFNKSHSAAYGLITYQTAWLKANYPVEFYAALLTRDQADTDSVVAYIQQARNSSISVLPPDVNESKLSFSVSGGRVRFGLGAIKGLGAGAIDVLIEARRSGPFASLFDLVRRIDTRKVNRKAMEVLIKSGAMDSFGQPRDVLWSNVAKAIERAQEDQRERDSAQVSLFGMLGDSPSVQRPDIYDPATEKWSSRQELGMEKEVLGFYVSGHPLDRYQKDLHRLEVRPLGVIKDPDFLASQASRPRGDGPAPPKRAYVFAAVVVVSHREMVIKDGRKMGITVLEDRSGQAEVLSFESKEGDRDRKPRGGSDDGADLLEGLDKMRELLSGNEPLLVRLQVGEDRREAGAVSLRIEGALSLEAKLSAKAEQLIVRLNAKQCTPQNLEALCKILDENRGKARLRLRINWPGRGEVVLLTAERWRVQVGEQLIGAVEKVFGRGSAMAG